MTGAAAVYPIYAVHAPAAAWSAKSGSESDPKAVVVAQADLLKATLRKSLFALLERCASFQKRGTDQGPV